MRLLNRDLPTFVANNLRQLGIFSDGLNCTTIILLFFLRFDPSVILVVDTRPAVNAMANKAGGKGYENDKFYTHINFSFRGIENIHKMRDSLKHLVNSVTTCNTIDLFRTGVVLLLK